MRSVTLSRTDWLAAAALWASTLLLFGSGAPHLGFYYDDAGYLTDLPSAGLPALAGFMQSAIRGRQLFVFWQYLFFNAVPHAASHLAVLHLLQSGLDGLVAAGFFLMLRLLRLPAHAAMIAAGLFAFWPIHGETHFWLTATCALLAPALLVILFASTSIILARQVRAGEARPRLRLRAIDAACFIAALFTYDQVFFALVGVLAARLVLALRRRAERPVVILAAHLPHLAALAYYLFLRPATDPAGLSVWRPDTLRLLRLNLPATISATVGRLWIRLLLLQLARAAWTDWVLALAVAAGITALALRLCSASQPAGVSASPGPVFRLGVLFCVAAYFPIWLWYISPRHHLLPSIGLFAAAGAALTWLLDHRSLGAKPVRVAAILFLGAVTAAFAAADRGESRLWEQSFTAKKQLFAELTPDLVRADVLVMDFPATLGPAMFITPHDAEYAPHLLDPHSFPGRVTGPVGGVPAPGGLFIDTSTAGGPDKIRYYPTTHPLIVRFTSWENGKARYEKIAPRAPYTVTLSDPTPHAGPFAIRRATARQEAGALVLSLDLAADLAPSTYLAATLSYFHENGFHRWGRLDRFFGYEIVPVLLGEAGFHPAPGGSQWQPTVHIPGFPPTPRIRLEFFQVSRDHDPVRLGEAETAVQL
ncbi:MAG TPA: hypothetical protein VEU62_18710 [Bryobacterales bacterium]|nr:hypothetical protein [Bryobacterales bacterium]